MPTLTEDSRQAIADILEQIAQDGLPGPRDLDVALDAIESSIDFELSGSIETEIGEDEHFSTETLTGLYANKTTDS